MNMNVRLEGKMEQIVDAAIAQGIVKTQMEAIRAGLLELNTKYRLLESYAFIPTEKVSKKELAEHKRILKEMGAGKEYSMEQVFGRK
jgi:Arc/MetJ-type ribon-helix-helix transcriptional regulator